MRPVSIVVKSAAVLIVMALAGTWLMGSDTAGRMPNTGPDISGTWERTPDDWFGQDPDNPVLPGGPIALKAPYAAQFDALKKKKAQANAAGTPLATTSSRCLPEGMPTVMAGLFPIEIIRDAKRVLILGEYLQQVRRIWLDAKLPLQSEIEPSFQGQSVGRWEADTLVVHTQGVRTDTLFYDIPHGRNMTITERIRLKAPDRLENQVVIDDPEVLEAPYRFTFEYKRSDYRIQEYVCENNTTVVDADGKTGWTPGQTLK